MSTLLIEGEEGCVKDCVFTLNPGESMVVGRSSSCDISIRERSDMVSIPKEERQQDTGYMSVSGRHVKISFHEPDRVEIQDLSSNGTFLNGERIEETTIDLTSGEYEIQMGTRETVLLSLIQFQREEGADRE